MTLFTFHASVSAREEVSRIVARMTNAENLTARQVVFCHDPIMRPRLRTRYAPTSYIMAILHGKSAASHREITVVVRRKDIAATKHLTRFGVDNQTHQARRGRGMTIAVVEQRKRVVAQPRVVLS